MRRQLIWQWLNGFAVGLSLAGILGVVPVVSTTLAWPVVVICSIDGALKWWTDKQKER